MSNSTNYPTTTRYADDHSQSGAPYTNVAKTRNERKDIDVHEMLSNELMRQSGITFTKGLLPPGNINNLSNEPQIVRYGLYDRFFYLDSNWKNADSDLPNGKLVYSLSSLNKQVSIDNIIEMEIGEFFIPVVAATADFPEYFFFKRLMLRIEEMKTTSHLVANDIGFHFELGVQAAGIANLITDVGSSKFIFPRPFQSVDRVTISFIAPSRNFKNVTFSQDIFAFNAVPGVAGGVFGGATITTTVPHGLVVGTDVSIFISGFNSGIAAIDNNINSPNGFLVRVINTTTLEFRAIGVVGFNFMTLLVPTPGSLLVGFRRIAFTLRMRSLQNGETNTIVPV